MEANWDHCTRLEPLVFGRKRRKQSVLQMEMIKFVLICHVVDLFLQAYYEFVVEETPWNPTNEL